MRSRGVRCSGTLSELLRYPLAMDKSEQKNTVPVVSSCHVIVGTPWGLFAASSNLSFSLALATSIKPRR